MAFRKITRIKYNIQNSNLRMNRSKSYTNDVRKKLTERQRDTTEVKEILTGAGFKKIKPKYSSKPTLKHVEAQHQVLSHEVNTEF